METIEGEDWKITKTSKGQIYIYELYHKPHDIYCPIGRYLKYTQEDDGQIVIIEDGPYLGQV